MITRRVLLVCDLDSQIFGALPLAFAFRTRGWNVTFGIESESAVPEGLIERLRRDFDIVERSLGALPCDDLTFDHDAVGVFATGSRLALFRHLVELSARVKLRPRPALFCGFNGLVFQKFEEGLAWRLGYDVIAINGPRDRDAFLDFVRSTEFEGQPCAIVGLRRKTDAPPRALNLPSAGPAEIPHGMTIGEAPIDASAADPAPPPARAATESPRKLFVFAEQVVVPRVQRDRARLVAILARLARSSPDWTVMLKARIRPDETTFHASSSHISALVDALPSRPANFELGYDPLDDVLMRADLFATISSTALFDALDHGVPSIVATDFGLRNADGAHVFFASGLLAALEDLPSLDAAPMRAPNDLWLQRMGYGDPHSPNALIDLLETFDPSQPMKSAFVTFTTAAKSACGPEKSVGVLAARDSIEAELVSSGGGDASTLGALAELAALVADALKRRARRPKRRNAPIARVTRRLALYWRFKRLGAKLGSLLK